MRTFETDRDRYLIFSSSLALLLDETSDRFRNTLMNSKDESKFLIISESGIRDVRDRERVRLAKVPRRAKELSSPERLE